MARSNTPIGSSLFQKEAHALTHTVLAVPETRNLSIDRAHKAASIMWLYTPRYFAVHSCGKCIGSINDKTLSNIKLFDPPIREEEVEGVRADSDTGFTTIVTMAVILATRLGFLGF